MVKGQSGAPANVQGPQSLPLHECGQVGSYGGLKQQGTTETTEGKGKKKKKVRHFERDHVPAKATLFARAGRKYKRMSKKLRECVNGKIEYRGKAVVIPRDVHRQHSETCGSKNKSKIGPDSKSKASMKAAVERDLAAIQTELDDTECGPAYAKAAQEVRDFDFEGMIDECYKDCGGR